MANVKISQLPAASAVSASSDVLPLVHNGVTVKATPNQIVQEVLKAPGAIGTSTPANGTFLNVTSTGNVTANGINKAISLSPTGTGSVTISPNGLLTIAPTSLGSMNNVAIGSITPGPATFNSLTLTGSLTASASTGLAGQVLSSTGTGVEWTNPSSAMTYPGAGIAVSTGSAWSTSLTAPSGALVGTTDTQTLTNKTISGINNSFSNIGNAALTNSTITFGLDPISLGGTISAFNNVSIGQSTPGAGAFTSLSSSSTTTLNGTTIPVSKTLVTLDDTQVLTNKTISGANNTLSNIGNSSLTNSGITFGATSVSLGGTISAFNNVSIGQSTPGAGAFTSLSSSSTTTLNGTTIPVSKTLVTLDDTQVLTNKTISGANNTLSNIGNSSLTNSGITFGATSVSLGGTVSALNAVSLGQSTAAAGAFTTLSASTSTTLSGGNLAFTGTGQRITGDMSNATLANRLAFQTSTADSFTDVIALPKGTGTLAQYAAYSQSDPTNASFGSIRATDGSDIRISSSRAGTGSYLPITFHTGGSERVRIDTSGNVGVGIAAAPAIRLHVLTVNAGDPDTTGSGTTGVITRLQNSSVNLDFGTYGSGACWIQPRLVNDNSYVFSTVLNPVGGNVGIGLAVPTRKLDVAGGNVAFRQSSNAANTSVSFDTTVQNALTLDSSGNLSVGGGLVMPGQQAQTSKSTTATLTGAELITGILQYTGGAATVTLPTGTTIEGALTWSANNVSLDWYVINTGSGTCTIGANGNTTVGTLTVTAATSAHFRIRRTAANTFTVYRVS